MTAIPIESFWISPEEYLEGEMLAETKHEYVSGQVYAMAGASRDHNLIAANAIAELHRHLRGKPCTVFTQRHEGKNSAGLGRCLLLSRCFGKL